MRFGAALTLFLPATAVAFPYVQAKGNEYATWDCSGRMVKKNHGDHLAAVRLQPETLSVYVNPGYKQNWVQTWTEHGEFRNLCGGQLLGTINGHCWPINFFKAGNFTCLRFRKRHSFTGH